MAVSAETKEEVTSGERIEVENEWRAIKEALQVAGNGSRKPLQESKLLVERVLRKIGEGTYGECDRCFGSISVDRRRKYPFCIKHQKEGLKSLQGKRR